MISNAIGPGSPNPATKSVLWSAALPVKPSGCSIGADVNPLPVGGGTVHLTASCNGDPVDTWVWSGPVTTSTGNLATASITVSTAFGVTATNGGGSGTGSLTVNVGGGGGGGPISCAGFLNTNSKSATWPNWFANAQLAMGPLDAAVYQFTTPSTGNTNTGTMVLYSGSGQDSAHDVFVSKTPCDFSTNVLNGGTRFSIGQSDGVHPVLDISSTYYINIRNSANAVCVGSPLAGACNINLNLNKPGGIR